VCAVLGPGKMCVPADAWGRAPPGDRFAGEACEKGSDCRSGACSEGGFCEDACCRDAECAAFDGVCRDGGAGWTCQPQTAAHKTFPEGCEFDGDCASGLCVQGKDTLKRCADPCCSSIECGTVKVGSALRNALCVPVRHGGAIVLACASASDGEGDRGIGEPC